jgi:hypothetical protein
MVRPSDEADGQTTMSRCNRTSLGRVARAGSRTKTTLGRDTPNENHPRSGYPAGIGGAGKTIGLGLDADLWRHTGTGAITYLRGGWQNAGLTNVHFDIATMFRDKFMQSFGDAAKNASAIRFDLTTFSPFFPKLGVTANELRAIIRDTSLLGKTTFTKHGKEVHFNGLWFQ